MTHAETVSRDSRSYRQGLVLGLTMAEVFLLLVFALLIALAALWSAERSKREQLESERGAPAAMAAAEKKLLEDLKSAISVAGPDKVAKALDHLREGRDLEPLSEPEKGFVDEVRRQQRNSKPEAISDQWRKLTRAAQNVERLPEHANMGAAVEEKYPDIKDVDHLIALIWLGILAEKKGEHDWPPIINLSEAKEYRFETGKAELTPDFEHKLKTEVVPLLQQRARKYGVTTIEVIGHTDEQKIYRQTSNLDRFLIDIVNNAGKVSELLPADNAGLGLARAAAVMRVLTQDDRMKGYTVLPFSAGQLINVDDRVTTGGGGDDKERRRIEIRLRRPHPSENRPTGASSNSGNTSDVPSSVAGGGKADLE